MRAVPKLQTTLSDEQRASILAIVQRNEGRLLREVAKIRTQIATGDVSQVVAQLLLDLEGESEGAKMIALTALYHLATTESS